MDGSFDAHLALLASSNFVDVSLLREHGLLPSPSSPADQHEADTSQEHDSAYSAPRQRRIRSHEKSRQGCFHCKRRKVKCQEKRPSCDNCRRNGLRCTYPDTVNYAVFAQEPTVPQVQMMKELHSSKLEYTAVDMRLLHNFTLQAYPHLPLDADQLWRYEIPAIAFEHKFLLHSILALSAAHLLREGKVEFAPAVYYHRRLAIDGLNCAMNNTKRNSGLNDALIGASYCLVTQNSYMNEGLLAYFITFRSCVAMTMAAQSMGSRSRFCGGCSHVDWQAHQATMSSKLERFPLLNQALVVQALNALTLMSPICPAGLEKFVHELLMAPLRTLRTSSQQAYSFFSILYARIGTMPHADFLRLMDASEHVLAILLCHFLALQSLMLPILGQEWSSRGEAMSEDGQRHSARMLARNIAACQLGPGHPWRRHLEWPGFMQRILEEGRLAAVIFEEGGVVVGEDLDVCSVEAL